MDAHYPSAKKILEKFDIKQLHPGTSTGTVWMEGKGGDMGGHLASATPIDGALLAKVSATTADEYRAVVEKALAAFQQWRMVPAPKRGEVVRQVGVKLRERKTDLARLVTLEMGKSIQEGLGEVQEMIDICDFAVGLSRQLHGFTMHSERASHRMYEQYHPLGIVGIISAFNFPVAVWSWNAMIALVCGNVCIWKPSEKTPLCAVACQKIVAEVLTENELPEGISCLINGDYRVGEYLTGDSRIALVSATGSVNMGRRVGQAVASRLGKSLLELGGNNAIIVTPSADLKIAIPGIVFGAVGTCGQRCTSTRRLIVQEKIFETVKDHLVKAYAQLKIGNPFDESVHVGPLIDAQAVDSYLEAGRKIDEAGGNAVIPVARHATEKGFYVKPAIYEVENHYPIVQDETFAPILYLIKYKTLQQAIEIQNGVSQGLSSAIMTTQLREAEAFLSASGSDCGIANVNIGTSGAEIGGAFGGEKHTGGGRESGSDAWKFYMRRQTNTINYGDTLPLAQGIKFEV